MLSGVDGPRLEFQRKQSGFKEQWNAGAAMKIRSGGVRLSIFTKLVVTFLCVLIPLYMVTFALNREGGRNIRAEITKSTMNNNNFYMQLFDAEVSRINQLLSNFVVDKDLQELGISGDDMSSYDRTVKLLAVHRRLQMLEASSNYVANVEVFLPLIDRTLTSADYQTSIPPREYRELAQNSSTNRLIQVDGKLYMSFRYPANQSYEPIFVIGVEFSREKLQDGLLHIVHPEQGNSILIDSDGGWLIADEPDERIVRALEAYGRTIGEPSGPAGSGALTIAATKYLVFYKRSPLSHATLISYEQETQILGALHSYERWAWALLALSALVIVVFAYSLFRIIHRPLRRLVFAFRKLEEGNLTPIAAGERRDEFQYMYQRFNMMVSKLDVLFHQVYEKEIRNRRLELKQLQSQINPHFLYNCFYILKRLIQGYDNEKSARFAMYLGDYFRFITRSASDWIPLETEMRHVRNYADIQTICYGKRIDVEIEPIAPGFQELPVPRMVILPIVENAYKYALHPMTSHGELWIHFAVKDGFLSIMVEDNGDHIGDAEIGRITAKLEQSGSDWQETTGLVNVHRRVRLGFGEGSGIALSRSQLGGLCVTLRMKPGPRAELAEEGRES